MRNKIVAIIGIVFAGSLGVMNFASADAIGMSPPSIDMRIFSHESRTASVNISRNSIEGDMVFSVVNDGMSLLTSVDNSKFVIPDGQFSADYSFVLDSANMSNGDYDGILEFHLVPPEDEVYASSGMAIDFVLKAKIHAIVLDRPDSSTVLSLVEFPELVSGIGLADYSVEKKSTEEGIDISFKYLLTNSENNPLEGAKSYIVVTRDGNTFFDSHYYAEEAVSANGTLKQFANFTLPQQYSSGKYVVHIVAGDQELFASFWIIKPLVLFCIVGFFVSLLASGLTIYFLFKRRRK